LNRLKRFAIVLVAAVVGFSVLFSQPIFAKNPPVTFQCQTLSSGVPATVATSPQWQNQPRQLIRWLEPLAYTPLRRCREVSNRLNKQFSKGAQYIGHGYINGNPAICTTNQEGAKCTKEQLLWTLNGNIYGFENGSGGKESPSQLLDDLFALQDRNVSGRPLKQCGNKSTFVKIMAVLRGEEKVAREVCVSQ
jgi:hypothetical protein